MQKKYHFLILFFISFQLTFYAQGKGQVNLQKVDSLKKVIASAKNDTLVAKALIELAWETKYDEQKNAEEACKKAIQLLQNYKKPGLVATAYKILGIICDETGKYDQSINYYLKSVAAFKETGDSIGMARTECNIGILYRKIEQPQAAIPYFTKCLPLFERKNFLMGVILSNMHIGTCYYDLQKIETALKYFQSALTLFEENNIMDPSVYGNMSNCYEHLRDEVQHEYYLRKCVEAFEKTGDTSSNYYFWLHNLGNFYCKKGNFSKGLPLIEQGLAGYTRLGLLKSKLGVNMLENAAKYNAKSNQMKPAYAYLRKALDLKDSLYKTDVTQQMSEQREKYEADKKELSISNLEKEKKIKDAEINQQAKQNTAMCIGLILVLFIAVLLFKTVKQKKKDNEIIKKQKELVDIKNKEVKDSITYAKRLQDAILPPAGLLETFFPESFLLYQPKDIVAGDFFWMDTVSTSSEDKNGQTKILIAAADCTGHGVPGAMVSLVCSTALNRAVKEFAITDPGKILDKTRELVIETFEKSGTDVKDGMDISLVAITLPERQGPRQIEWAGANNPVWYTQENTILAISPNKQPIGKHENPEPFTTHCFELQAGEQIFLFTDGFVDQFGGEKGKKFMSKNLREMFQQHLHLPLRDQKASYEQVFKNWSGHLEQVDDVTLIGFRV